MGETTAKKEKEKKKAKAKQDKAQKMKERKDNNTKGKSLDDMLAYVDENGNLSPTAPDPSKKTVINAEDISLSVTRPPDVMTDTVRKGVVTYYNDSKGYGFITDSKTKENVFVHVNQVTETIKERDTVTFEAERTPKGLSAIRVKKA